MKKFVLVVLVICGAGLARLGTDAAVEWPVYGGDQAGTKFSPLAQINRQNVHTLRVAWEWKTGDAPNEQFETRPGMFENTPLMIGGVLYVTTPYNRVVALEAETGAQIWSYDPRTIEDGQPPNGTGYVHRGIAAWRDGGRLRLFLNTRYRLICLDAETGKPMTSFGTDGIVDLSQGLVRPIEKLHYTNTSPPVVYKDLVILGNGVGDRLAYKNDPPGDVRAFNARTGKQVWSFHTIPQQGEFGNDTWQGDSWKVAGHTNVWAPMTLDERRGLAVSTGLDAEQRLLRRGAPRREPLRRIARLPRRQYRHAQMAFPNHPPRRVGLRPWLAAQSRDAHGARPKG